MTDASAETGQLKGYHAHIYFDGATRGVAQRLCERIDGKFKVTLGRFVDEPRGPHPFANCVVMFEPGEFQKVVPWLMLNREGLDILVHPLTDSSYDDHSRHALWLGRPVPLNLGILRPTYPKELYPA